MDSFPGGYNIWNRRIFFFVGPKSANFGYNYCLARIVQTMAGAVSLKLPRPNPGFQYQMKVQVEDSPTTCPPFSWWRLASILGGGRSGPCRCHLLQRSNPPSPWWSNSPLRRWEPRKERVVETPPGLGIPSKSRRKSRLWSIYICIYYLWIWSRCVYLYIYIYLKRGIGKELPSFRFGLRSMCIDAELNENWMAWWITLYCTNLWWGIGEELTFSGCCMLWSAN